MANELKTINKSESFNIFLIKKLFTFGCIICLLLSGSISVLLYYNKIQKILVGTKFKNSGIDIVAVIQDSIQSLGGIIAFFIIAYFIISAYSKINELLISKTAIINILLVFTFIIFLNSIIKVVFTDSGSVVIGGGEDAAAIFNKFKELKGFATGLDMVISSELNSKILVGLIQNINLLSIAGFVFIYSQINKFKKNSILLISLLAIAFILITSIFNIIDISNIIVWSD